MFKQYVLTRFIQFLQAEKEVQKIQKSIKGLEEELRSIQDFKVHSDSQFINGMRPRLITANPTKYRGKEGRQELNKDLRYLKVATKGKIPSSATSDELKELIISGKRSVGHAVYKDLDDSCTPSASDQTVAPTPSTPWTLSSGGGASYSSSSVNSPYSQALMPFQYLPYPVYSPDYGFYSCPSSTAGSSCGPSPLSSPDMTYQPPPLPTGSFPPPPPPPSPDDSQPLN